MKKIIITIFLLIPFLCGCIVRRPLISGTYEAYEISKNDYFSKARYVLTKIDEETYNQANKVNVIECAKTGNYFSFELYFYFDILNKYEQIEVNHLRYLHSSRALYAGYMKYESDIYSIDEAIHIDFLYNTTAVSMDWQENEGDNTINRMLRFEKVSE